MSELVELRSLGDHLACKRLELAIIAAHLGGNLCDLCDHLFTSSQLLPELLIACLEGFDLLQGCLGLFCQATDIGFSVSHVGFKVGPHLFAFTPAFLQTADG